LRAYFARANGIPEETEAAARALLAAKVRPVSVGIVNDQLFLANAVLACIRRRSRLARNRRTAMAGIASLTPERL
jgi:diacylglycerol kinase family enzyme